jgi:acetyl-CoA synthetase
VDLAPLLAPRSLAVVGATEKEGAYADTVLRNLATAGFAGPVWGVNPKRSDAHGRPCVPSVSDLPEPVDAVVVAIPAPSVPGVVREAGERGCGGAIVLSAGFGEVASGRALEEELRRAAADHGLPVCGPNGNGIVAVRHGAAVWGDRVGHLEPGGVAMVTQSGNVGVNALGSQRGIRWHTVVSVGNGTVCTTPDWLAALAETDGVRSVALFCEADGDGAALAEALAACAERGIGVAVLKVGASEAGQRAASAHTGSLAGDQRVFRALVEEAGGAWAEDFHDLLELAKALAEPRARPARGGGLAVLTCSGGDSGVAADEATRLGVELPELAPATRERLARLLPDAATIGNPLDYTAMIWGDAPLLAEIIETVGADPAIAQLLLLYDHPADVDESWAEVRRGLIDGARAADAAAIVASTLPDLLDAAAADELSESGLPAIAGLRTALLCARALRRPPGDPARLREIAAATRAVAAGEGDGWLAEAQAKELLREAGVAVPPGGLASDADEAARLAAQLGYPVALKLSGPHLLHKSELGALALGLREEAEVRDSFARLRAIREADGADVLVEAMAEPGVELVIAARGDAVVPALVVGLGGIWTEALDDVAVIPLPADATRIERELRRLRGAPLLFGGRGREGVDVGAVCALAEGAGRLLLSARLSLLELNPVIASAGGAVAADALARR